MQCVNNSSRVFCIGDALAHVFLFPSTRILIVSPLARRVSRLSATRRASANPSRRYYNDRSQFQGPRSGLQENTSRQEFTSRRSSNREGGYEGRRSPPFSKASSAEQDTSNPAVFRPSFLLRRFRNDGESTEEYDDSSTSSRQNLTAPNSEHSSPHGSSSRSHSDSAQVIDPLTSRRYRNELIPSRMIHVVSATSSSSDETPSSEDSSSSSHQSTTTALSPPQPLSTTLQTLNPQTHYLEAVSTHPTTNLPICKIISKKLERERLTQLKQRRKETKHQRATKYIEMNWTIAPGDMAHRLEKVRRFVGQGMRVEVLLARKRKGQRYAEKGEAEECLGRVREVLGLGLRYEGGRKEGGKGEEGEVREWAPMRGEVGKEANLYLEGGKRAGEGA